MYDVSDPSNPVNVGAHTTSAVARSIAVFGNYVFLGLESGSQILDVTDPTNPMPVASSITAFTITISGTFAYVGIGSGFRVVDISDPSNPVQVGGFGPRGNAQSVALSGNHAPLADGLAGLQIIDISNLSDPALTPP